MKLTFSEEMNLFTYSNNHFLAYFSPSVKKFEAQNMKNEGSLGYKLYKTISFLPPTSFLSFDFIINKSNLQNTNSCVKLLNQSLVGNLLYSLTCEEFLEELIFKRRFESLHVLMIKQGEIFKGGICIILPWTILS
ncbi:hypothetical protein M9H77_36294 [Catharanthus roseus]|uniref:Uncharacterized protein n=1 Tax=Catharanthus roseus TaxID=4058 RepID=A0ACB9ZSE2_CATRO|nr:hypothetical protein M9H77_36294 [Catharanthus roseus]